MAVWAWHVIVAIFLDTLNVKLLLDGSDTSVCNVFHILRQLHHRTFVTSQSCVFSWFLTHVKIVSLSDGQCLADWHGPKALPINPPIQLPTCPFSFFTPMSLQCLMMVAFSSLARILRKFNYSFPAWDSFLYGILYKYRGREGEYWNHSVCLSVCP